jgi:hypothetical protein
MADRTTGSDSKYFSLSMESLRDLGGWAADFAEYALPAFEKRAPGDSRPREAIEGIRAFAAGGKRTARLRTLALAAHAAARDTGDPAAAAAARAAGLAAASAYTHPLADVDQTKHVVGPAAYAALALELDDAAGAGAGEALISRAIASVPPEARGILMHMPARPEGKSRLDKIMRELDAGIRGRG